MSEKGQHKQGGRGWNEEDQRLFSDQELRRLRYAQEEVGFLLDRNYPMESVIKLVGGRYQFSSRQRLALQRSTCGAEKKKKRLRKELGVEEIRNKTVHIDGFNLIITLEVWLSGGLLLQGEDGLIRDLAGLRGSYRLIEQTKEAIELIGEGLREIGVRECFVYLDAPISNSGRMKKLFLQCSEDWGMMVNVEVVNNPDPILEKQEMVITSDSIILDRCVSYVNFARYLIQTYGEKVAVIDLECKRSVSLN